MQIPVILNTKYRIKVDFPIHIGATQIIVFLRRIEYNYPLGKVEKTPESYNWTLDRSVYVKNIEDLDYIMGVVVQSYNEII